MDSLERATAEQILLLTRNLPVAATPAALASPEFWTASWTRPASLRASDPPGYPVAGLGADRGGFGLGSARLR